MAHREPCFECHRGDPADPGMARAGGSLWNRPDGRCGPERGDAALGYAIHTHRHSRSPLSQGARFDPRMRVPRCCSEVQSELAPLWIGGTGSSSDAITGEFGWLETMESGNRNMPAIASLHASLQCERMDRPERWEQWVERILAEIRGSKRLRLIGPDTPSSRTRLPVISIAPHPGEAQPGICQEWAMVLESTLGIECRAGFHCAGRIHEHLGTIASGGTLRFSLGHTTSEADIDAVCEGIRLLGDVF